MFYKIKGGGGGGELRLKLVFPRSLGQSLNRRQDLHILLPALSFSKCQTHLRHPNKKKIDGSRLLMEQSVICTLSGVIWRCHEVRSWGKDNVLPQRKSRKSGQRQGLQRPAFTEERDGWWDAYSLTDYLSFKQENTQISALRKAMNESWKNRYYAATGSYQ